ncbi:MAG: peptide/nickel transport system permease protein [Frankiales bacterium]|jgi:peptide/nickel transport system permease protein|nr:peptide/nickel transport system permease protein [Frankiales bacterium]
MANRNGSLRGYIVTRLLLVVPNVWILLTVVFILMRVAPGDPVQAAQGGRLPQAQIDELRHAGGFDKPLIQQYGTYLNQILHGNLGHSSSENRSVWSIVTHEGAATLELSVAALLFALVIGLSLGLLIGRFRDSLVDVGGRLFGILTYAAPVFYVGILLQLLFVSTLGWLPGSGQADTLQDLDLITRSHTHIYVIDAIIDGSWDDLRNVLVHLILPGVTLGLLLCGVFVRLVRVNIIQTMQADYIEAARARGIGEFGVLMRHAFRNALVPVVTIVGLQAALLLSGAVLTETTFNWPGIGQALIHFLNQRDYAAVQGIVTVFALIVVGISLIIDLVNALIDPRVRY